MTRIVALEPSPAPDAASRARLIHRTALASVQGRLWRSALGAVDERASEPQPIACQAHDLDLQNLIAAATATDHLAESTEQFTQAAEPCADPGGGKLVGLGVNRRHAAALEQAAERTGVPAAALAAIVDAEAGKDGTGRWITRSRNPRSSAAGLGQFLSRTWNDMAERKGSWLNRHAGQAGWLDADGRVRPSARAELLALRYDAQASIEATADYAAGNLAYLRRRGIPIGSQEGAVARAAYLAHHLGPGDAVSYLRSRLPDGRARTLLAAQIGSARASSAIFSAGDPSQAHRIWLESYVARHVRPTNFT